KVDVIYTNTDNNVVSAYESLVKVGTDTKTPLIASDTDSVKRGAIAALGIDYYEHGVQAGKLAVRVLQGEAPGTIAPEKTGELSLYVNRSAAKAQGVTLPQELLDSAAEIIDCPDMRRCIRTGVAVHLSHNIPCHYFPFSAPLKSA